MRVADRLTVAGFRLAWWAGEHLPEAALRTVLRAAALVMWRRNGRSVRRLRFNAARAVGVEAGSDAGDLAARAALLGYFDYWASMFCLGRRTAEDIDERVRLIGSDRVAELRASGRGVLVVAPHSGNWDLVGAWAAERYGGITTVAERLEPVELFDLFVSARTVRDIEILPHRGGQQRPLDVLSDRLAHGRVVGLAADRDLSRRGLEVELLGHPARMPAGPAHLAHLTGCALLPIAIDSRGPSTSVEFQQPLDTSGTPEQVTQRMADAFGEALRAHPESWYMLQQVWLDHPVAWGGRG